MEYTNKGDPFRLLSCAIRSSCFEKLSRLYVEHQHGVTIDADRRLSIGGHKLGKQQGSYDYGICQVEREVGEGSDVIKVEVKSARLGWDVSHQRWMLPFVNIKVKEFDRL
eukprot:5679910-Amphidinium_carterae.1